MTISTSDQFRSAGLTHSAIYKNASLPTLSAASWTSYWQSTSVPAGGSAGSGATDFTLRDYTTTGAMNFINSPNASGYKQLFRLSGLASQNLLITLYDRIADTGAITIVPNGSYTWTGNFTAQRPTSGEGHELWAEVTSATAAYDHTLTFTYLDSDDVSRTGTIVIPASTSGYRTTFPTMYPSVGMKKVTAITGSGNALATGAFALLWVRKIATINLPINQVNGLNWADLGFPIVYNNSCISFTAIGTTTTATTVFLEAIFKDGGS